MGEVGDRSIGYCVLPTTTSKDRLPDVRRMFTVENADGTHLHRIERFEDSRETALIALEVSFNSVISGGLMNAIAHLDRPHDAPSLAGPHSNLTSARHSLEQHYDAVYIIHHIICVCYYCMR